MALYQSARQPIQFSHRVHAGPKAGLKCEDCHSFRDDGAFTGIPALDKCAGCHAEPLGSSAEEKLLVKQYVSKNREIAWLPYAKQPENVSFSHIYHVKRAGIACERCHGLHAKSDGLRPMESDRISGYKPEELSMNDCASCHAQRGVADSCFDCHK